VNLRRQAARPLVIGHRGAAARAPENTLEGLEAAVTAGADLVEFDVGEGLVLGHPGGPERAEPPTLDDALEYLAASVVGAHIDLKHDGIEPGVAAAVRRHGFEERALVSSTHAGALRRIAVEAPELTRAISYPHDRYGASRIQWPRPIVDAGVACLRPIMRVRLPPLLYRARASVLSLRHELAGRALVETVHARRASVLVWTVNDPSEIERLARLGVDAIVSDDPEAALRVVATLNLP
jgi:glycerophosphoryl diester phosphodiesterase